MKGIGIGKAAQVSPVAPDARLVHTQGQVRAVDDRQGIGRRRLSPGRGRDHGILRQRETVPAVLAARACTLPFLIPAPVPAHIQRPQMGSAIQQFQTVPDVVIGILHRPLTVGSGAGRVGLWRSLRTLRGWP